MCGSGARRQLCGSEQLQCPASGMLDSLLKSSAGAVVTEVGHVMRRSFSDSGRMQYHLEAPPLSGAPPGARLLCCRQTQNTACAPAAG